MLVVFAANDDDEVLAEACLLDKAALGVRDIWESKEREDCGSTPDDGEGADHCDESSCNEVRMVMPSSRSELERPKSSEGSSFQDEVSSTSVSGMG